MRDKEAPYIQRGIDATRTAFGLNTATATHVLGQQPDAAGHRWPPTPTPCPTSGCSTRPSSPRRTPQLQQIRGFYDFGEKLDIDRYTIDGKAPGLRGRRPRDRLQQLAGQQTQLAERAHRLHPRVRLRRGAGQQTVCQRRSRTSSPASSARRRPERQPMRHASTTDQITVDAAAASTTARAWAPTPSSARPTGRQRRSSSTGPAGEHRRRSTSPTPARAACRSARTVRRILYAYKYKEPNFLLSSVFNDNSKVLYVRDPRERVREGRAVPDPRRRPVPGRRQRPDHLDPRRLHDVVHVPVLAAGRPAHRDDATHRSAPASPTQAEQNINYIRNSVKATVDAYDGTVTLYEFDDTTRSWTRGTRRSAATSSSRNQRSRPTWPPTSATRRTCSRCSATC